MYYCASQTRQTCRGMTAHLIKQPGRSRRSDDVVGEGFAPSADRVFLSHAAPGDHTALSVDCGDTAYASSRAAC